MREINEIRDDYKNYFNLVKEMVIADFKLRYQGSVLGVLWSLLQPLMLFGVLFFVFSTFARFEIENYALHLLLGIALWNFFSEATTSSINSLFQNSRLLKKIYFPRSSIIVSSTIASLINFVFSLIVFFIFVLASSVSFSTTSSLAILFIINLFFTTLGISFMISSLSSKLIDLKYIWPVLLRLGFWLTPIVYSIKMIPGKYHFFIYLNPLTRIIQYTRESLLQQKVSNIDGIIALNIVSLLILIIGLYIFDKRAPYFTEEL